MSSSYLSSKTYWNAVVQLALEQGIDVSSFSSRVAGKEFEQYVPFSELKALVEAVGNRAAQPSLGLELGPRLAVSSHGSVGYALSSCRDLNECFQLISQYDQTRFQFLGIKGELLGNDFQLTLIEKCDWQPVQQTLYEAIAIGTLNVIAYVVGDKVKQCRVHFPFAKPQWFNRYQRLYHCEYLFDQSACRIFMPAALLSVASISFDQRSLTRAKEQCDQELISLRQMDTFQHAVRSWLEEGGRYNLNIEEVAKHFNISISTLIRKLKRENCSYKSILEEMRKTRASNLLRDSNCSVEAIAYEVGYSDVSNFGRSFKRWFACSPLAYRQRYK